MKQAEIVKKMTLEQKAAFVSGYDYWHLEEAPELGLVKLNVTDGPHGLRKANPDKKAKSGVDLSNSIPTTCFPTAATTSCSWDPELLKLQGEAMAEECLQEKVSVILGPGANIKRSPTCGRNFEYFSEDPLLAGECAAGLINGIQSKGVGTSLKHFACNNRESNRFECDSRVSQRALREIYLRGFEICVKEADPWTVMSSYNLINGKHTSESYELLTKMLREEWGFKGMVTTDWGAHSEHCDDVLAGGDMKMGEGDPENLKAALNSGKLLRSDLEACAKRVLELFLKFE